MHGKGAIYSPNGLKMYEGAFKDNLYHGYGKLVNDKYIPCEVSPDDLASEFHWKKYEGEFFNG